MPVAGPALALSCARPDVTRSFQEAAAAETAYVIVHGTLDFDAAALPEQDLTQPGPESTPVAARIEGLALTPKGFSIPFDQPVTLDVQCLGPWCAGAEPGSDVLAFVERDDTGFTLRLSPCPGTAFFAPSAADLQRVTACLQGRNCETES
ncbi:hypothetical protein [Pseudooceanicola sp. LIPI14-2-Ac024]|uniref:hypothetical protein n=1 Tax=Pseudooceanicola sp. LIPI14-2-Ac024 TaxID=3344875 RepID=UPI0035CF6A85